MCILEKNRAILKMVVFSHSAAPKIQSTEDGTVSSPGAPIAWRLRPMAADWRGARFLGRSRDGLAAKKKKKHAKLDTFDMELDSFSG